ncbi:MAG: hypothetical protein ACHP7K_06120 [Actinomycetales bacterium]
MEPRTGAQHNHRPGTALPAAAGLMFRPITAADLDNWLALTVRIAAAERPPWHPQRADLEQTLDDGRNDPRVDTVLGLDAGGVARAYACASRNPAGKTVLGDGGVDLLWERRRIGTALLAWLEARTRERFAAEAPAPAPAVLRVYGEEDNPAGRALYAARGMTVARYFYGMLRPLAGGPPPVPAPEGVRILDFSQDLAEVARCAHNEAFADHWGSEPRDEAGWARMVGHPLARHDWSAVALDTATGEVAGYQLSSYDPQTLAEKGRREGYTDLLGVRPPWRGRCWRTPWPGTPRPEWTMRAWMLTRRTPPGRCGCTNAWDTGRSAGTWRGSRPGWSEVPGASRRRREDGGPRRAGSSRKRCGH